MTPTIRREPLRRRYYTCPGAPRQRRRAGPFTRHRIWFAPALILTALLGATAAHLLTGA